MGQTVIFVLLGVVAVCDGFSRGWTGSRFVRKSMSMMNSVPILKSCSVFVKDLKHSSHFYKELIGLPTTEVAPTAEGQPESTCVQLSDQFNLFLKAVPSIDSTRKINWGQAFRGIGIVRPEAEANAIWQRLEAYGVTAVLPFEDYHYGASEVPDEHEDLETHLRYAIFPDPTDYQVEIRDSSYVSEVFEDYATPEAASNYQHGDRIALYVEDLNDSIAFYTTLLGLTLLRRRSEVNSNPAKGAQTAYVGNKGEDGKHEVYLELKYIYNTEKVNHGANPLLLTIAVPDIEAVLGRIRERDEARRKKEEEEEADEEDKDPFSLETMVRHEDGSVTVKDPNGHNVKLIKLTTS